MPKEKVLLKDLVIFLVFALCGVGINQWLFKDDFNFIL
jgi:hypothetical protein